MPREIHVREWGEVQGELAGDLEHVLHVLRAELGEDPGPPGLAACPGFHGQTVCSTCGGRGLVTVAEWRAHERCP